MSYRCYAAWPPASVQGAPRALTSLVHLHRHAIPPLRAPLPPRPASGSLRSPGRTAHSRQGAAPLAALPAAQTSIPCRSPAGTRSATPPTPLHTHVRLSCNCAWQLSRNLSIAHQRTTHQWTSLPATLYRFTRLPRSFPTGPAHVPKQGPGHKLRSLAVAAGATLGLLLGSVGPVTPGVPLGARPAHAEAPPTLTATPTLSLPFLREKEQPPPLPPQAPGDVPLNRNTDPMTMQMPETSAELTAEVSGTCRAARGGQGSLLCRTRVLLVPLPRVTGPRHAHHAVAATRVHRSIRLLIISAS